jgi:predicted DNA-binding protein (MmcQ/YjbR family)
MNAARQVEELYHRPRSEATGIHIISSMAALGNLKKTVATLRTHALGYPETVEDFPWGHSAFKVKGKAFLFTYLNEEEGSLSLSMKLPQSGRTALLFPFAKSTGYGLGKSGWVTSTFHPQDDIPIEMLLEWVDESFRAIAPKRVLAALDGAEESRKPKRKNPRSRKSRR